MKSFQFSYPVSRPYPYRWFKWVVLVGGICLTVLFSFVSVAANGYDLKVEYTTDYNGTVGQQRWTQHFPFSIFDKAKTTCQVQNFPTLSQIFTDKVALPYTLSSVWQAKDDGTVVTLPTLEYANSPLENCSVNFIAIDLESTMQRSASQIGWTPWGPQATAQVTCAVENDEAPAGLSSSLGPTFLNLSVAYNLVSPAIEIGVVAAFVQPPNATEQASLWWGESLLSWYWLNLAATMQNNTVSSNGDHVAKGSLSLRPARDVSDVTSLDFFGSIGYHFTVNQFDGNGALVTEGACCINPGGHNFTTTIGNLAANNITPNIWVAGDTFAKVFYATVLADLGQVSAGNILANPSLLDSFSANITEMAMPSSRVVTPWLHGGPAKLPYNAIRDETGPLGITPSYIYTNYLCQVPQIKSPGQLFIAVLLADLVFLQAIWMILRLSTVFWIERHDPHANYCEGCLRMAGREDMFSSMPGAAPAVVMSSFRDDRKHNSSELGIDAGGLVVERKRLSSLSEQEIASPRTPDLTGRTQERDPFLAP